MKTTKIWIVIVLSTILMIVMCFRLLPVIKKEIIIKPRNDLDHNFYLKMQRENDLNMLKRAEYTLNDQYMINNYPVINKPIDNVWSSKTSFKSNSHELYTHSLTILWDLILAHQQTNDLRFLIKGKEIIESWIVNNNPFQAFISRYSWSEHSTATRTITILIFYDYCQNYLKLEESFEKKINNYCSTTLFYLSDEINYTYKNNHGIFQDIALLFLSDHISNEFTKQKYRDIAINRFEAQIESTISDKGVHLENSAGYNFVISNQINTFLRFLNNETELSKKVLDRIKLLEKNKGAFLFPNSELAPIGDTHRNKLHFEVEPPIQFSILDTLAGYGIYKNVSNEYLMIRSNGVLSNHLHNDQLSFVFYADKNEIVTEPGFLDFSNSLDRKYSMSIQSHNSLLPIKMLNNYDQKVSSRFVSSVSDEQFYYIELDAQLENNKVKRELFLKHNSYLIIKDLIINNYQDWLRSFTLSEDIKKIIQIGDKVIEVIYSNGEVYYFTSYLNPIEFVRGEEDPKLGWLAEPGNKLIPTYTIIQKNVTDNDQMILGVSNGEPIYYEQSLGLKIKKNDNVDSIQSSENELVFNENLFKKTQIEQNYNKLQSHNILYKIWLRVRDYRIQLIYLIIFVLFLANIYFMIKYYVIMNILNIKLRKIKFK